MLQVHRDAVRHNLATEQEQTLYDYIIETIFLAIVKRTVHMRCLPNKKISKYIPHHLKTQCRHFNYISVLGIPCSDLVKT